MDTLFTVVQYTVGSLIGIILFLFLLPLIPTAIERLSNKPNRFRGKLTSTTEYPVSPFGFFTSLAPGQVKIIEASDRFIRCIMRFDGHTFAGEVDDSINPHTAAYWEVRKTNRENGEKDAHPIRWPRADDMHSQLIEESLVAGFISRRFAFLVLPLRRAGALWARWVYKITGYVFVGIYPYRRVRTYSIKRFRRDQDSKGREMMVRIRDYSDHFRVADFQMPIRIPEADTKDMQQVAVELDDVLRVFNPFLAAYETDDWAERVESATHDRVTEYTRSRMLNTVVAAKSTKAAEHMARSIKEIGEQPKEGEPGKRESDTITTFGIKLQQVLITDISPVDSESEAKKRLADLAFARQERQAKEERAKGDAAQLREQINVVQEGGAVGLAVLAAERNVRTAKEAGKSAIVVVGGGTDVDPIQAAILQGVRNINLTKSNQATPKKGG